MGPSTESFAYVIYFIGQNTNLDMEKIMSFKEGVFYYVLYAVITCVFAMILLFLHNILFIKEEQPDAGLNSYLKRVSDTFIPL